MFAPSPGCHELVSYRYGLYKFARTKAQLATVSINEVRATRKMFHSVPGQRTIYLLEIRVRNNPSPVCRIYLV